MYGPASASLFRHRRRRAEFQPCGRAAAYGAATAQPIDPATGGGGRCDADRPDQPSARADSHGAIVSRSGGAGAAAGGRHADDDGRGDRDRPASVHHRFRCLHHLCAPALPDPRVPGGDARCRTDTGRKPDAGPDRGVEGRADRYRFRPYPFRRSGGPAHRATPRIAGRGGADGKLPGAGRRTRVAIGPGARKAGSLPQRAASCRCSTTTA